MFSMLRNLRERRIAALNDRRRGVCRHPAAQAARWVAMACVAFALSSSAFSQPGEPGKEIRIILVGDSTMAVQSGWGPGFCALVSSKVDCVNMARSGRSS